MIPPAEHTVFSCILTLALLSTQGRSRELVHESDREKLKVMEERVRNLFDFSPLSNTEVQNYMQCVQSSTAAFSVLVITPLVSRRSSA